MVRISDEPADGTPSCPGNGPQTCCRLQAAATSAGSLLPCSNFPFLSPRPHPADFPAPFFGKTQPLPYMNSPYVYCSRDRLDIYLSHAEVVCFGFVHQRLTVAEAYSREINIQVVGKTSTNPSFFRGSSFYALLERVYSKTCRGSLRIRKGGQAILLISAPIFRLHRKGMQLSFTSGSK